MTNKTRKIIAAATAVCAAAVFTTACGAKQSADSASSSASSTSEQTTVSGVSIANPWFEYATQEEAQDDGFAFMAPFTIDDYTAYLYRSMKAAFNNVEEVDYKAEDGSELALRKGQCEEDEISGDYNTYADTQTVEINGNSVTICGNDGTYSLATWTNGDYAYSVYSSKGLAKEQLTAICDGIE